MKENIKRISIIGGSGTGKTTLANNLGKVLEIPVYHIDGINYFKNWEQRDKKERDRIILDKIEEKRWVIDIDDVYPDMVDIKLLAIYDIIRSCTSKWDDPIVVEIPTKTGCHLITHPFNTYEFEKQCQERIEDIKEVPGIKKNHITLLYENL